MRSASFFSGWAEVRITGPEPERLLTRLSEQGIPFRDASPPKDFSFTLRVPYSRVERVLALSEASGCEAEVLARGGLAEAAGKLRRRALSAAVLAGLVCLLLWSHARIWYIDISGNETIPDGVILQALEDCGVAIGARWTVLSQDGVRNAVLLRVPGLRWLTVTMRGSRAEVIVREALEKPELPSTGEWAEITADRAGLVTRVYALRGTAETAAGRFVLPGDVIIGGYDTGRFGVRGPARAVGWAEARTWYEITAAAPSELAVKVPAGEKTVRWALILGGTRINFSKDSSICPEECDKIIESFVLAVPGVFTLPVALERTTFSAYAAEPMEAAELPEELSARLREELMERLGDRGAIVSEDYTVWQAGGFTLVTLEAECLERLGVTVPLTDERLAEISARTQK